MGSELGLKAYRESSHGETPEEMEAEAEKAHRPLQRTIQKPVWLDERFLKG